MTIDQIIEGVLEREGGYSDRPEDAGGPTNFGITLATLTDWRHPAAVSAADVQALSRAEAWQIYRRLYVADPGFETIADDNLRALLVDMGVNHGPARAIRWLQRVLGLPADGKLGPATRAALAAAHPRRVYLALCAARARIYGGMIADDPRQARFARGWLDRVADWIEAVA